MGLILADTYKVRCMYIFFSEKMIQTNVLIDIIRLKKPVLFKQWNMALLFYDSYSNRISINLKQGYGTTSTLFFVVKAPHNRAAP